MNFIWNMIQTVSDRMRTLGALFLAGMAALTCIDVVGRYFRHPVFGSVELVTFMGVLAVAFSLPDAHRAKSHIGVEILMTRLSSKTRTLIDICTQSVSFVFFALITWRMFDYGIKMMKSGEVSMNLQLPEYLIIFTLAFCFVIFSLMILKEMLEKIGKLRGK